jgi:hypothetical protein
MKAQWQVSKHVQLQQSIRQTKSFSTHYNQTIRLNQRVRLKKVNWNRVNGALNLDIESQGEADKKI